MKVFITEYSVGKAAYSSFVYAATRATAESYISIRGIRETIVGELADRQYDPCPLPSNLYQMRKLIKCVHCLTFYSWIAGHFLDMHDELLRDDGVLHEIMHEMELPIEHGFRPLILDRLEDLERLIPGLKSFDRRSFDAVVAHG